MSQSDTSLVFVVDHIARLQKENEALKQQLADLEHRNEELRTIQVQKKQGDETTQRALQKLGEMEDSLINMSRAKEEADEQIKACDDVTKEALDLIVKATETPTNDFQSGVRKVLKSTSHTLVPESLTGLIKLALYHACIKNHNDNGGSENTIRKSFFRTHVKPYLNQNKSLNQGSYLSPFASHWASAYR